MTTDSLRILIDVPVHQPGLDALRALPNVDVALCDPIADDAVERPVDLVADREILFCAVPPKNLDDMHALRWIQIGSSGFEHLIPLGLPARGIRATNARGIFDVPIAEWCVSMMVNLTRDLPGMYRNQQEGHWDRDARFQTEVRGRTVGFWGYGGLARETARLAKAMGLRVHVLARNGVRPQPELYRVEGTGDPDGALPDRVYRYEEKAAFLGGLDYLVLALPLNASTKGIVTAEDLRLLQPTAMLLNPARGPLVPEDALIQALREGWIAGAALDTHYHYPTPPDHPLWHMPNVVMTPHIAGSTKGTHYLPRVWDLLVQNVRRYQAGEAFLNEIAPEALEGSAS